MIVGRFVFDAQRFPETSKTEESNSNECQQRKANLQLRHTRHPRRSGRRRHNQVARRSDLPDHVLRVRRCRPRRATVRPAGVRQHLHPHHEPDHRRLREAHRGARRRSGRAGAGLRTGRRNPHHHHAGVGGRRDRLHDLALRRHLQPVPLHAAQARASR